MAGGDTGAVAADHYHRYRQDAALMADLGLGAYRFSVAWPRVQPDGRGPVNPEGLDFYRRLADSLLERGIEPWVTLYHWDLPQALQDRGGWASREVVDRFVDYAAAVYGALSDRVANWTTLNEPWCAAFLGHAAGVHAPGVQDPATAVRAAHHLLVAHGQATRAMRALDARPRLGINLNLDPVTPASAGPADADAARRIDGVYNRLFLDPLFRGRYPADVLEDLGGLGGLDRVGDDDLAAIAAPLDLLGVNYYRRWVVAARPERPRLGGPPSPWVAAGDVEFVASDRPRTALGWEIDPSGLDELLLRLHRDYPPLPLYVTENGAAFEDGPDAHGRVRDRARIRFLDGHLRAAHRAIQGGVDLRGYFVWSLLDNFEWAEGYAKRFGIVYVDFPTQRRLPKDSALWYRDAIARGGLDGLPCPTGGQPLTSPPTLEQVAALAGVSRATVSRVVNGSPKVSPVVRAQVERAVAKLGYVPNRAARSLVTRRADSVALVVSEPHARFFSEPFFAGMVRGVSAALAETGVQLLLLIAQDLPRPGAAGAVRGRRPRRRRAARLPARRRPAARHPGAGRRARRPGRPPGRPPGRRRPGPTWTPTTAAGPARRSTTWSPGAAGGSPPSPAPSDMGVGLDRLDGYRDGLAAAGLDGGRRPGRGRRLHRGGRGRGHGPAPRPAGPPVDAVFAASDLMAAGRPAGACGRPAGGSPTTWPWSGSRTRRWPATPSRPSPPSASRSRRWAARPPACCWPGWPASPPACT